MVRRPERDGSSPEGCRGWLLDGPLRLSGPWALSAPGRDYAGCDSRFVGLFAFYYFAKKRFSLVIRGPLWLSPTITNMLMAE
jgi:hypothetical protein